MQTKKQGFTLIELLVVIVIIGILATIAIPQFTGYFAKARDSERASSISSMSTLMKVAIAGDASGAKGYDDYSTTAFLQTEFDTNGYSIPASKNDYCYYYGFLTAAPNNEFFFASPKEETGATGINVNGTAAGVTIANGDVNLGVNTVSGTCNTMNATTTGTYTVVSW